MTAAAAPWFGGLELGGTKVVCAVGREPSDLADVAELPTTDPLDTLHRVTTYFRAQRAAGHPISALGIGSFGPIELDESAPRYGHLTTTPKPGWAGVDLLGHLRPALEVPLVLETDVGVAALAEGRWGAARDVDHFVYVTVGTGVGGAAVVGGRLLRGAQHPELGHLVLPRSPAEPASFESACPYHPSCVEGLASGRAVVARWGQPLGTLDADHPAWALEADYLASFLADLTFAFQPGRIVAGGGVVGPSLLEAVRPRLTERLGGYRADLADAAAVEDYLVPAELGPRAGALGGIALARHGPVLPPLS